MIVRSRWCGPDSSVVATGPILAPKSDDAPHAGMGGH